MRNLEQKKYRRKVIYRSEDLKIAIAKDYLFSSSTMAELEIKWQMAYCSILKITKKYDFEYFQKQKLNKSQPKLKSLLKESR